MAGFVASLGDDCPVFTWNGAEWQIIPNLSTLQKRLDYGGFGLDFDSRFCCLVAPFLSLVTPNATALKDLMLETPLTYLGDEYQIKSVVIYPSTGIIAITANALNQKT